MSQQKNTFTRFANWAASAAGNPKTFAGACLIIVVWAMSGPLFGFSDTWQLVINTGTTIITFLMVFVIQNSQNRDSRAMQIKLDEIIRAMEGAHNGLLDLEELTEDELNRIRKSYTKLAALAREELAKGLVDTDKPEVSLR